jgi:heptosyltransferase-2
MTLPALEAIGRNFPESSITVVARPWVLPLFANHPFVDDVIPFRKERRYRARLGEFFRVIRKIQRGRFDLAILFQNAFEAALLAYLGRIPLRLGYNTDGRGFLLTHGVIRDEEVLHGHQVLYYLNLLKSMGWEAPERDPSLPVDPGDLEKARDLLRFNGIGDGDILVGLCPGAIFGEAKRWPPERFAIIGDWAALRWGATILVMGSRGEMEICRSLCSAMTQRSLNLCGRTSLGEVMGVIKACRFFVSNDSGLMHVASALGVPTVAIFGSTDPIATGPRGPSTRIVTHDVSCAPCLRRECPTDYRCLLSIDPEEVWEEMEALLEKKY